MMIKKLYRFLNKHPIGVVVTMFIEAIISIFAFGWIEWLCYIAEISIFLIVLVICIGMDQRWCEDD